MMRSLRDYDVNYLSENFKTKYKSKIYKKTEMMSYPHKNIVP